MEAIAKGKASNVPTIIFFINKLPLTTLINYLWFNRLKNLTDLISIVGIGSCHTVEKM
jgi:hypothetical protein